MLKITSLRIRLETWHMHFSVNPRHDLRTHFWTWSLATSSALLLHTKVLMSFSISLASGVLFRRISIKWIRKSEFCATTFLCSLRQTIFLFMVSLQGTDAVYHTHGTPSIKLSDPTSRIYTVWIKHTRNLNKGVWIISSRWMHLESLQRSFHKLWMNSLCRRCNIVQP